MCEQLALVVEDEPLLRALAVETIAEAGVACLEAGDAAEAVALLAGHPEIGLLFTDVNMPGMMDGVALAWYVHRLRPDICLVITSGRGTVSAAALPGDSRFLPKPYRAEDLISLIAEKPMSLRLGGRPRFSGHVFV